MLEETELGICSRLLAGELQLIRTYEEAIGRFEGSPYKSLIETIRRNHEKNSAELRAFVHYSGKAFADLIPPGTGRTLSMKDPVDLPALEKLTAGEKHALAEYGQALEDREMPPEVRRIIQESIVPRLQGHVVVLWIITPSALGSDFGKIGGA